MLGQTQNRRISFLQALILYIAAIYAPNIRFLARRAISEAHQAAWLTTLVCNLAYIPLVFVFYQLARKFEGKSFHDIVCRVLGKPAGKAVSVVLLLWMLVLLGLYIKYTGNQLATSAYVGTDVNLLMFLEVAIIAVMLRWGLQVFSRMSTVIFLAGFIQFFLVLSLLLPEAKIGNLTPVSTLDIGPVFKSIVGPMTTYCYLTLILVFNDQIHFGKKNFALLASMVGFFAWANTTIIIALLGLFGYELIGKLNFPFLMATENILIFNASAGMDALFLSLWLLYEFVTAAFFAYCVVRLIRGVFSLQSQTPALTAVMGFTFVFAIFVSTDMFEMIKFSEQVIQNVNLALGFFLPILLYVTAKARRLI